MFSYDSFKFLCIFVVLVQSYGVVRWIYQTFVSPRINVQKDFTTFGEWAVVTGATDGIGKAYARSLAKRGLNIILISRSLSKLESVAKEIQQTFNVQTAVIDVDFTSGPEIYDKIKDKVKGKEIGILVNNVGMCLDTPDYFLSVPNREKFIQNIINCNITSMPMMCSIIMPQMVQRKRGLVINIGSITAFMPSATVTMYAATKAFVNKFSEDLSAEYEKDGILVQAIRPGPVSTKLLFVDDLSRITPSADEFSESALRTVGFAQQSNVFLAHGALEILGQVMNFISPRLAQLLTMKSALEYRSRRTKLGLYESATN